MNASVKQWATIGAITTAIAALLVAPPACADVFYQPDRKDYGTPTNFGLKYEELTFQSKDGTKLSAWFVPATAAPIGTVVHFHGNAQNMSAHFSYVAWLARQGFNVFTFDYRGYGRSEGTPQREGIYEDSLAALRYVKSRTDIAQDRILILGQSLGGAIAIPAVATGEFAGIRGVIVESTFYSYKSVAADKAPAAIVDGVISDACSPGPLVSKIAPIPLLIIHGTADNVVPCKHAERLFAAAQEPKTLWMIKQAGHTPAFAGKSASTYRPKLVAFFKACLAKDVKDGRSDAPGVK